VRGVTRVLVATDDERVARAVRAFGGDLVMTRSDHVTGTDRVAEVAKTLRVAVVVNLQGDEPVFDPEMVERMVARLARDRGVDIVTACHALYHADAFRSPHVVKVVIDKKGHALYFSRSPIPSGAMEHAAGAYRHIGAYAFRRDALARFTRLPRTPLEISERLEQLRALEHGFKIAVVETDRETVGVDVPADIKNVERAMRESID
jgi:3-deoxy-manno-octulosonate cytidylyltransferase (CMP-KDO synthetase)